MLKYVTTSQIPPNKLDTLLLPEIPQVLQSLLTKINILHIRRISSRRPRNPASHNYRISLKYNSIITDLVNRQCNKIIVVVDRAFVCRVPILISLYPLTLYHSLSLIWLRVHTSIIVTMSLAAQAQHYTTVSRSPAYHPRHIASHHSPS